MDEHKIEKKQPRKEVAGLWVLLIFVALLAGVISMAALTQ